MTAIGITGAAGFVGWHLRCRLHANGHNDVKLADRATFTDPASLDEFVAECDSIIHVAGVNRAADNEAIRRGNIKLAHDLVDSLRRTKSSASVVFTNSAKIDEPGAYGESKLQAAAILAASAVDRGAMFDDVVLPHLFGEFGKPFYNAAVHTFAYQITHGEQPEIHVDADLELLHVQDAAQILIELALAPANRQHRPQGRKVKVSEALEMLQRMAAPYLERGSIPELFDRFELQMFNLLRSNLMPDGNPVDLTVHSDARGGFYEVLRAGGQGQTSISTTVPGVTRGDHYHLDKIERFVVVGGHAAIRLRKLFDSTVYEFKVWGDRPVAIDMPPLTTHNITNTGEGELVTLFWSNDHFDPDNPDTFPELVEPA